MLNRVDERQRSPHSPVGAAGDGTAEARWMGHAVRQAVVAHAGGAAEATLLREVVVVGRGPVRVGLRGLRRGRRAPARVYAVGAPARPAVPVVALTAVLTVVLTALVVNVAVVYNVVVLVAASRG